MLLVPLLAVPAIVVGAGVDVPPPSPAAVESLCARLRDRDAHERRDAADALARLPPTGFDLYVRRLFRPRPVTPATLRALLLEIWAQVPNPEYPQKGELWARKPEPKWTPPRVPKGQPRPKRPPPHDPEQVDWLASLAALDLDGSPALRALPDRVEARAEALEAVALLRAIAATGRFDAVDPLFDFAFALEGVFRDECGRAIRSMGSAAIPGLVERQHRPGPRLAKQHRWAIWQLDRMDRARPSRAVATATDDRVRAAILHAYGATHAVDAVEAVLDEVDSPSRQVRREARAAWMGYVSGPAPPPAPMRKRKLPGGKEESEAKEDYLNYREMAELVIRQRVEELHDDGRPVTGSAEALTRELFAHLDARRSAEWESQLAAAEVKRAGGDVDGAIAGYLAILAHDPSHPRRAAMAEVMLARGETLLAQGDETRGADLLRQAVAMAPDAPRARAANARLAYLDGVASRRIGQEDLGAYRRALALDPSLDDARRALAAAEGRAAAGRGTRRAAATAGAGLAVVLALYLAALFGWRARRRLARPAPPVA